jgi:2-oxoglutarate dehydrogenase complex dehydrogenase (E1) component-like enzyme
MYQQKLIQKQILTEEEIRKQQNDYNHYLDDEFHAAMNYTPTVSTQNKFTSLMERILSSRVCGQALNKL